MSPDQHEIEALLRHIRRLVRARDRLRHADADGRDLERRNAEIASLHAILAARVRRALREGARADG
jgi:hypothetical protein